MLPRRIESSTTPSLPRSSFIQLDGESGKLYIEGSGEDSLKMYYVSQQAKEFRDSLRFAESASRSRWSAHPLLVERTLSILETLKFSCIEDLNEFIHVRRRNNN